MPAKYHISTNDQQKRNKIYTLIHFGRMIGRKTAPSAILRFAHAKEKKHPQGFRQSHLIFPTLQNNFRFMVNKPFYVTLITF